MFIDEAEIEVRAGNGGDGIVSFRREKYVPKGGPDGGDGGDGGSVVLQITESIHGLANVKATHLFKAEPGERGRPKKQHGANGSDIFIAVPPGTAVYELVPNEEKLLVDFGESQKQNFCVAKGGKGGLGNDHFKSATNQVPREATPGTKGEKKRLKLVVRHLADIGIIGLPNVGKSTLVSKLSNAKPEIGDYQFTTLEPHLGVVIADGTRFTVADIPGLIQGASVGRGLGHKFLKHLARTKVLVHLVDASSTHPETDYKIIREELANFNPELLEKTEIVALSKIDLVDQVKIDQAEADLSSIGVNILKISSETGEGLLKLRQQMLDSFLGKS